MKKIYSLVLFTILLTYYPSHSQTNTVWVTIPNLEKLELIKENDRLGSTNPEIGDLITTSGITSIVQIIPSSRKKELLSVYELTTSLDQMELLVAVSKLNAYFKNPEIGPNYQTLAEPNDYNTIFEDDYTLNMIGAQHAWSITEGDSNVVIAISDQNYYYTHEELIGKVKYIDTTNMQARNHGTAVAVMAAGNTNNSLGNSSIGYNSSLALYRMSLNDILTASYSGYRIINISWASGCSHSDYTQAIIDEVYENGSVIVSAAGNGGTCGGASNYVYPASCDHVISVTGIGKDENHERIIGDPTITFQHNDKVDISAPGYDVVLSDAPGSYITGTGSSFASPIVSGTIALMFAANECLTNEEVEAILYATTVNIDEFNLNYVGLLGNGRLNAGAAVEMAARYNSCGILWADTTSNGGDTIVVDPGYSTNHVDAGKHNEFNNSNNDGHLLNAEMDESVSYLVYPNPIRQSELLNIRSELQISSYQLYSTDGKTVQNGTFENSSISISNLIKGTYFIYLFFENGQIKTEKITVL